MTVRRLLRWSLVVGIASSSVLAGCTDIDESSATERAQAFVDAANAQGVASGLDAEAVESIYGDSAPTVCGVIEDDPVNVVSWARVNRGMPIEKVTELVENDRLVVATYCPDLATRYEELLDDLNYEP